MTGKSKNRIVIFSSNFIVVAVITVIILSLNKNKQEHFNDFRLYAEDGSRLYYNQYYDKKLVLVFYATWCGICKYQISDLNQLQLPDKNIEMFTVCIDPENRTEMRSYIRNLGSGMQNLLDDSMSLMKVFDLKTVPAVVILHKGRILYKKAGYNSENINKITGILKEYE